MCIPPLTNFGLIISILAESEAVTLSVAWHSAPGDDVYHMTLGSTSDEQIFPSDSARVSESRHTVSCSAARMGSFIITKTVRVCVILAISSVFAEEESQLSISRCHTSLLSSASQSMNRKENATEPIKSANLVFPLFHYLT